MAKKRSHPTHPTKPRPAAYTPPAMSDAELFRPQPETTALPSVLATVFSLTLHGLLWAAPPILSMSRQKPDFQRTVELVQLTPAEISRLPQYADPVMSLPPLPPPLPSTDVLPPPSLPSPLEPSSTQTLEGQEALVRQQIVQRQEQLLQQQLQKQEELFQQRMRQQEELLQKQKLEEQQKLRRELEQERQREIEQMRRERELEKQRQELEKQRQEQLRQLQEKQRQAALELLQEQEKQRQQQLQREIDQQNKRQEIFRKQRELELSDEWKQQEKLISQLNKELQRLQKADKIKAVYGYSTDGTTLENVRTNLISFFDKIRQFAGDQRNLEQDKISIRIDSPIKQKLPDVTPAGVALLIDENGNLSTDPMLTRSTGYPALNDAAIKAAIEDVKKRSFPRAGQKKIYQYEIEINQNNEASP
jgi:hypothetical protein